MLVVSVAPDGGFGAARRAGGGAGLAVVREGVNDAVEAVESPRSRTREAGAKCAGVGPVGDGGVSVGVSMVLLFDDFILRFECARGRGGAGIEGCAGIASGDDSGRSIGSRWLDVFRGRGGRGARSFAGSGWGDSDGESPE